MFITNIDGQILEKEYRAFLLKFAEMMLGKKETFDYFTKLDTETLEKYMQSIRVNDEKATAFYMGMAYATYQTDACDRGVDAGVFDYVKYLLRNVFGYRL